MRSRRFALCLIAHRSLIRHTTHILLTIINPDFTFALLNISTLITHPLKKGGKKKRGKKKKKKQKKGKKPQAFLN